MSEQSDTPTTTAPPCATSLPPELLSRIFEHHIAACKAVWDDGAPYDRIAPASCSDAAIGPYTWLRVTHVCAYWRAVALANPLLWSHVVLVRSVPCVEAVLARSSQAPLTVQSYAPRCSGEGAFPIRPLKLVLQHIHRVHALDLRVKWWAFFDYIAPALEQPALLLARVHLATPSGFPDDFPLAPTLALSPTTPLRDLELSAYCFPWGCTASFGGLRSLTVRRSAGRRPTPLDVLTALAHMPLLTGLCLDNIFDPSPKDTAVLPLLHDTVALPELETLTLTGDSIACTTLACAIRAPARSHTRLTFTCAMPALALCVSAVCAHLAPLAPTVRLSKERPLFTTLLFTAAKGDMTGPLRLTLQVPSLAGTLPTLLCALPETATLCSHTLPFRPLPGMQLCTAECAFACA